MRYEFTEEYLKKHKKERQLWNGEEMIINPFYTEKRAKKDLQKTLKRNETLEKIENTVLTQDQKDEIQEKMHKRLALAL